MSLQEFVDRAADALPPHRPRAADARPRPGQPRTVLRLEVVGDDWYDYLSQRKAGKARQNVALEKKYQRLFKRDNRRPWVAKVIGIRPDGWFEREFQRGQKDYSHANSSGSRGVFTYYALRDGCYEVFERLTWTRTRRYYVRVRDGEIEEIEKGEVLRCLQSAD